MFITKKHLSRRTVLRGVGASVALPLLDSMVARADAADGHGCAPKTRFAAFYVPHGATMDKWTPASRGHRLRVHGDPEAARAVTAIASTS